MVTLESARPSFLESWAQSLVFLWMARIFEEGNKDEAGPGQGRPHCSRKEATAEVLFWADGEHTNCLTDMIRTDMGTGWEEEEEQGNSRNRKRWGEGGRRRGGGGSGPSVWSVVNGLQLLGLCPVLVGWSSGQSVPWLGPAGACGRVGGLAAASVHVLVDFLEQGVQQGFALCLL